MRKGRGDVHLQTCSASSRTSSIFLRTIGQRCSEGKFLSETGSCEVRIHLGNEFLCMEVWWFPFSAQILGSQGYLQCGNVAVTQRDNLLPEQYKEQDWPRTSSLWASSCDTCYGKFSCLIMSSSWCYCCDFPTGTDYAEFRWQPPVSVDDGCCLWQLSGRVMQSLWKSSLHTPEPSAASFSLFHLLYCLTRSFPTLYLESWRPVGLRTTGKNFIATQVNFHTAERQPASWLSHG